MRILLRTALLAGLSTLALATSAQAAVMHAEGSSTAGGFKLSWAVDLDDATKDLTVNVTQVNADTGAPSNLPCTCGVLVTLANNQQRTFDFVALGLLNAGPVVQGNVNAKSFLQRGGGSGLTFTTSYVPPTG